MIASTTFATLESVPTIQMDAATSVEKIGVMPGESMYTNGVKYEYDADAVKTIHDQKSSLIEVICQSEDVFKNLGINSNSIKINNIGFSKNDLDITVDAKNCSFYANRTNRSQTNNGTTDEKAIAAAKKFADEVFGAQGIVALPAFGKAEITRRDNGGMMYPMVKEAAATDGLAGVEMLPSSGTDEHIDVKYNTINILLPYEIGGTPVYSNYGGGKLGVTITVDGNGISNVSVPLLAFKGIAKTAEKNTLAGLKNFIAQWGNNPYRGAANTTVKLNKPERVLVYFNYYPPMWWVQRNFLSDGIRLGSNMRVDQYQQMNYEMVLSDFVIGNNNNPILMDTTMSASSNDTTTKSTVVKKKIRIKRSLLKK